MSGTVLIFGGSGLFKTTNLSFGAKYLYERTHGKKIRLITADGGGNRHILGLEKIGVLECLNIMGTEGNKARVLVRKLSEGYWPDKIDSEGFLLPDSKLIAPNRETWQQVGGYIVEGLSSISTLLMSSLQGKKLGINASFTFTESAYGEQVVFGSSSQDHYGFVQNEVRAMLRSFGALPVERVLVSAHETKGEDEDTKQNIRGPELAGKAATDKVARDAGTCLHFDAVTENVERIDNSGKKVIIQDVQVRAFFLPHPDTNFPNIIYKSCKARVPPEKVPELLKIYPNGFFVPTFEHGLDEYLRVEDELIDDTRELEKWKGELESKWNNEVAVKEIIENVAKKGE